MPTLAPLLRDDLGLTRQEAGSFLSAFYVGGALTSFPAGRLADRIGVRWTLLTGQALVGVCFALMVWAPGYLSLLALVTLAGVGFVGALADRLGSYGPGWIALAGAMAIGVLLLLGVREPSGHAWR